ncbi:hypothetical protein P389DRAFT_193449 [Cystobasidium minutum MCA 4210]|uniref:uncharacterized protein n=1 Tax=Cystobasidium minutum MCA 4210 TaxID=1397322 RepID=UPI0034CF0A54|eukprot:jgi/Rhomi1/193449/gm1.1663_g
MLSHLKRKKGTRDPLKPLEVQDISDFELVGSRLPHGTTEAGVPPIVDLLEKEHTRWCESIAFVSDLAWPRNFLDLPKSVLITTEDCLNDDNASVVSDILRAFAAGFTRSQCTIVSSYEACMLVYCDVCLAVIASSERIQPLCQITDALKFLIGIAKTAKAMLWGCKDGHSYKGDLPWTREEVKEEGRRLIQSWDDGAPPARYLDQLYGDTMHQPYPGLPVAF